VVFNLFTTTPPISDCRLFKTPDFKFVVEAYVFIGKFVDHALMRYLSAYGFALRWKFIDAFGGAFLPRPPGNRLQLNVKPPEQVGIW